MHCCWIYALVHPLESANSTGLWLCQLFSQSMHLKYIKQFKKPFKCKYNEFVHFIRLLYLAPCEFFNIPERLLLFSRIVCTILFYFVNISNIFPNSAYIRRLVAKQVILQRHGLPTFEIRLRSDSQIHSKYALQILSKGKETTQLCIMLGKYQLGMDFCHICSWKKCADV